LSWPAAGYGRNVSLKSGWRAVSAGHKPSSVIRQRKEFNSSRALGSGDQALDEVADTTPEAAVFALGTEFNCL
jgi:hypothetical protein